MTPPPLLLLLLLLLAWPGLAWRGSRNNIYYLRFFTAIINCR